jgi:hypothetical protein
MITRNESLGGPDAPMKDCADNTRNLANICWLGRARTRWNFQCFPASSLFLVSILEDTNRLLVVMKPGEIYNIRVLFGISCRSQASVWPELYHLRMIVVSINIKILWSSPSCQVFRNRWI